MCIRNEISNACSASYSCGDAEIVVAGGMENMSLIPHYMNLRNGTKFGPATMIDGMQKDGLVDAYDNNAMGVCADLCAEYNFLEKTKISTQFNRMSVQRKPAGKFDNEVVLAVPQRKGDPIIVSKDEEFTNVNRKIPTLNAVFSKEGTVTAANASTINDGAAAMILMSEERALSLGLKPLAFIKSYADAAQEPKFTTSPSKALPKALDAGIALSDVEYFEFNEAFAVVGLQILKIGLDNDKVNVGHPFPGLCSNHYYIIKRFRTNNAKKPYVMVELSSGHRKSLNNYGYGL
jgi:acetyl-CoA C-acetyltransferase